MRISYYDIAARSVRNSAVRNWFFAGRAFGPAEV